MDEEYWTREEVVKSLIEHAKSLDQTEDWTVIENMTRMGQWLRMIDGDPDPFAEEE